MAAKRVSIRGVWVVGLIGCLVLASRWGSARSVPDADGRGSMFGKTAPAFRIKGPHGETYTPDRLKGNILVIQFGSSW